MKTREELHRFAEDLEIEDLMLAVGVFELLRRADGEGRAERSDWMAAVRDELGSFAGDARSPGATMRGSDGEPLLRLVEARVLPGLEEAGIARTDAPDETWASLVVDPDLWAALSPDRDSVLEGLRRRVDELEEGRVHAFRLDGAVGAHQDGESRMRAEGLTKVYRRRKVVNEVDISVNQGEIVGLLGPNGAGKTTTFYMMVGLIPPDAGRVFLDGDDLTSVPMFKRARKGIGYLAQEPSVFRKLTVEDNVLAILETLKLPRKEEKARLDSLLGELGLSGLRKSKAYSLSGGERRRLEITRALVQRPKFMLLDEPFAGIDPIAVNDIQQIVRDLKSRGIGVIISDHNVEQTLEIVDRAYIMYEGRIRVSGSVSELVWNDEVAEIYLGPTLTQRMRGRYTRPHYDGANVSAGT